MARRDEASISASDLRPRSNEASRPFPRKPSGRRGILSAACVDSAVTARCGDAPASPPWPQPKSLAAGPHAILKQALNALASDDDGQVRKVEFYLGSLKLGEDTNSPFGFIWTNAPEGSYTLTAVATDNAGGRTTSAPVNITLFTSLVFTGSVWKYLDTGSNLFTAWRGGTFDDQAWAFGPAQLGYGDGDEATVVNGGPSTNHFITTYFRRRFFVNTPSSFTNLLLRVMRDDGAVVYLNGKEVFRSNMPNGPIGFNTLAWTAVGGPDESTLFPTNLSPSLLVNGTNLLAVEIHQAATNSSDISFDLELLGLRPPPPPRLSLQLSGDTGLLEWSAFAQGFALQSSAALDQTSWACSTNMTTVTNSRNSVSVSLTDPGGFYRLKKTD